MTVALLAYYPRQLSSSKSCRTTWTACSSSYAAGRLSLPLLQGRRTKTTRKARSRATFSCFKRRIRVTARDASDFSACTIPSGIVCARTSGVRGCFHGTVVGYSVVLKRSRTLGPRSCKASSRRVASRARKSGPHRALAPACFTCLPLPVATLGARHA